MKKQSLGRGLSALLENAKTDVTTSTAGENAPVVGTIAGIQLNVLKQIHFSQELF